MHQPEANRKGVFDSNRRLVTSFSPGKWQNEPLDSVSWSGDFGGNLSRMVTTLLKEHIEGGRRVNNAPEPDCLERLVTEYCPALSAQAKEYFKSVDQQSLATKLMEALVESFRMQPDHDFIGDNTPYDVWV
ncbi:MAG: hypothetical protein CMD99_04005 [Gammaproteobacteria bacterium]|nr:hypothetical protein [Gammaproteobacteria bacterium]